MSKQLRKPKELTQLLESLGSTLQSQIMDDLNAWEDRNRLEQPSSSSRSNKRSQNKRQRLPPQPDLSNTTLLNLRTIRRFLYEASSQDSRNSQVDEICKWAVDALTVFVSVADMRDNFELPNLISLHSTKVVFEILVLTIETAFIQKANGDGAEAAELEFIDRVIGGTTDSRSVAWILYQYGCLHLSTFLPCLHKYNIGLLARVQSQLQQNVAVTAMGPGATGLAQALDSLSKQFPKDNERAVSDILYMYRALTLDSAPGIKDDMDMRRYILYYLVQGAGGTYDNKSIMAVLQLPATATDGLELMSMADMIRFEMQSEFSWFLVFDSSESTTGGGEIAIKPLTEAISTLFCAAMPLGNYNRSKKPTASAHQYLDIARILNVLSLINILIKELNQKQQQQQQPTADGQDVEMAEDDNSIFVSFVEACYHTLTRLIAREQQIIVLNQLSKTVKNMPQPIPNGLQEAVQKGGRTFNGGPITAPAIIDSSQAESLCEKLIGILAHPSYQHPGQRSEPTVVKHSYKALCNIVPMLVEILASRMSTTDPVYIKYLVRPIVGTWPLHSSISAGSEDMLSIRALYASLLAIGEGSRGMLLRCLLTVFDEQFNKSSSKSSLDSSLICLLSNAVRHGLALQNHKLGCLYDVREVISDLCGVFAVNWRHVWTCCFGDDELACMDEKVGLVRTLNSSLSLIKMGQLRAVDRLALAEHALFELTRIRDSRSLVLARSLMGLLVRLSRDMPGMEQIILEKLLRVILIPKGQNESDRNESLDLMFNTENRDFRQAKDTSSVTKHDLGLQDLIEGKPLNADATQIHDGDRDLAERVLWQNAIRPIPRYPRNGMMNRYDRTKDAWSFVKKRSQAADNSCQQLNNSLVVTALLSLAHSFPLGMEILGQLLEEYFVESIPSMSPIMLDERLNPSSSLYQHQLLRLGLQPEEMELLDECRRNRDLECIITTMLHTDYHPDGPLAVKRLVSGLVLSLVVYWNGALSEATTKRPNELDFTTRLVSHIANNASIHDNRYVHSCHHLCKLFPLIGGSDLSRLLYSYVWRWLIYQLPASSTEAQQLLHHILRKHIVNTAPILGLFIN